jgi:hypothetical protein
MTQTPQQTAIKPESKQDKFFTCETGRGQMPLRYCIVLSTLLTGGVFIFLEGQLGLDKLAFTAVIGVIGYYAWRNPTSNNVRVLIDDTGVHVFGNGGSSAMFGPPSSSHIPLDEIPAESVDVSCDRLGGTFWLVFRTRIGNKHRLWFDSEKKMRDARAMLLGLLAEHRQALSHSS